MPTAGTLEHLEFPKEARVDSGIREGDEVTVHYDPMIAKVIVAGEDREQAIRLLDGALNRTHIGGLCNNVNFVRSCLNHDKFRNGDLYTGFIAEHQDELLSKESGQQPSEEAVIEGAIAVTLIDV
jgi:3-methylcrotonyl-CoA carboxylase alpha subunit